MKKSNVKLSIAFLFDDTLDSNDGVAQYVKRMGDWFGAQGHEVTYLVGETTTKERSGSPIYSLARNLRIRWGGNRLSISLVPKLSLIKKALAENVFDVIHVQVPYSPFMAQQVINRASQNTVVVGTVHVLPGNKLAALGSRALKTVYGRSLKRFDMIASVSLAAKDYAKQAFGVEATVLPNVIDLAAFRTGFGQQDKAQNLVFLGRLVKRKGCEYLIRAFAEVAAGHPRARLIIAGDGPERRRLQALSKRLGISSKVSFLGFISEEEKPAVLAQAAIACFPSLYGESFGIVLIEAMAAGAGAVIGGNNPGYASVLSTEPETLVNPRDTKSFSSLIDKLLSDKKLAQKIHQTQQQQVKQYDINEVGSKWLNIYEELIAKRQQRRHN